MRFVSRLLFIFVSSFIFSIFLVFWYSSILNDGMIEYSAIRTRKIVNSIVNDVVYSYFSDISSDSLFNISRNNSGDIEFINYNNGYINGLIGGFSKLLNEKFYLLESGNINELDLSDYLKNFYDSSYLVYSVSLGASSSNIFFSNFGPKIPLAIKINDDMDIFIDTKVSSYGINNTVMEIYVNINISSYVILPFSSKCDDIVYSIPISTFMINGNVPKYYLINDMKYES